MNRCMCLHVRCACWHCDTARCNKTTGVSHRQLATWTAPLRVICPSFWTSPVFATRKKHECMCLCKRERAVPIILSVVCGNEFWQFPYSSHWTELTTFHCFLKLEWTAFFCSGATNVTTHIKPMSTETVLSTMRWQLSYWLCLDNDAYSRQGFIYFLMCSLVSWKQISDFWKSYREMCSAQWLEKKFF